MHYDIFNHEHVLLPIFHFNNLGRSVDAIRDGAIRAQAASGQPIELSAVMAMLVPFAIYLGVTRGQRRWYGAAVMLLAGDFACGSRTGLIAIVVMLIVFLWLRPRQTLRCWPALIPILIVVHFLDPGAIGGFYIKVSSLRAGWSRSRVRPSSAREGFRRTRTACRDGVPSYTNSRITTRCSVKGSEPGLPGEPRSPTEKSGWHRLQLQRSECTDQRLPGQRRRSWTISGWARCSRQE